jgi:hypothetical protein
VLLLSEILGSKFASSGNFDIRHWGENTNSYDSLGKVCVLQGRKINLYGVSSFVYGYRGTVYIRKASDLQPSFTKITMHTERIKEKC